MSFILSAKEYIVNETNVTATFSDAIREPRSCPRTVHTKHFFGTHHSTQKRIN